MKDEGRWKVVEVFLWCEIKVSFRTEDSDDQNIYSLPQNTGKHAIVNHHDKHQVHAGALSQ